MEKKETRNSGIELLRIISMFLIILFHICINNNQELFKVPFHYNHIWISTVGIWGVLGVCIFFTISAWYILDDKYVFRIEKILFMLIETIILAVGANLCVIYMYNLNLDSKNIIVTLVKAVLSPFLNTYWFLTSYVIVYFLSPFLRKFLKSLNFKASLFLVVILSFFIPLYKSAYYKAPIDSVDIALYIFILTFFIKENFTKLKKFVSTICIVGCCGIPLTILIVLVIGNGSRINMIVYDFVVNRYSVFMAWIGVSIVALFINGKTFYSKTINFISQYTFGIYILHSTPLVANMLWNNIFQTNKKFHNISWGGAILIYSIAVYFICLLGYAIIHFFISKIPFFQRCKRIDKINELMNSI